MTITQSKDRHGHSTMVLSHAKTNDRMILMDCIDYTEIKKKKNLWELTNWLVSVVIKFESGWKKELTFKNMEDADEFLTELDNIVFDR